jgi:hypothetical protein
VAKTESLLEKGNILRPAQKTYVGYRMNENARVFGRALIHQVRPELTGMVELRVDLQRL